MHEALALYTPAPRLERSSFSLTVGDMLSVQTDALIALINSPDSSPSLLQKELENKYGGGFNDRLKDKRSQERLAQGKILFVPSIEAIGQRITPSFRGVIFSVDDPHRPLEEVVAGTLHQLDVHHSHPDNVAWPLLPTSRDGESMTDVITQINEGINRFARGTHKPCIQTLQAVIEPGRLTHEEVVFALQNSPFLPSILPPSSRKLRPTTR